MPSDEVSPPTPTEETVTPFEPPGEPAEPAVLDPPAEVDVIPIEVAQTPGEALGLVGPGPEATPAAPALDPSAVLEAVAALGEGLGRRLDALQAAFDREVRAEATREKVVDRLHAELQEYKQGLILGILRPVFMDLIDLHDDVGKMLDAQARLDLEGGPEDPRVARLLEILRGFRQGIEDVLDRHGVEPYEHEGDAFDPSRQRALSTVPTDDPGLARRVAARVRKGFRAGDRIIRLEYVSVYKPAPAAGPA